MNAAERDFPPKQCIKVPPFSMPASINMFEVGIHERILESPLSKYRNLSGNNKYQKKSVYLSLISTDK